MREMPFKTMKRKISRREGLTVGGRQQKKEQKMEGYSTPSRTSCS